MKPVNVAQINKGTDEIVQVTVRAIPQMQELANRDAIANLAGLLKPNIEEAKKVVVKDANGRETAFFWCRTIKPFGNKLDSGRKLINKALKAEVDGRFQPLIDEIDGAVGNAEGQIRAFDEIERKKAVEAQRKADEERRKQEAELERRRKIQDAAIAAGKEKRTEIPAEVVRTEIAAPTIIAEDKRTHYRLRYEVTDANQLPDGFFVKEPDRGAINKMALALEDAVPKDRKGIDDVPQKLPGVRFFWDAQYRMA